MINTIWQKNPSTAFYIKYLLYLPFLFNYKTKYGRRYIKPCSAALKTPSLSNCTEKFSCFLHWQLFSSHLYKISVYFLAYISYFSSQKSFDMVLRDLLVSLIMFAHDWRLTLKKIKSWICVLLLLQYLLDSNKNWWFSQQCHTYFLSFPGTNPNEYKYSDGSEYN